MRAAARRRTMLVYALASAAALGATGCASIYTVANGDGGPGDATGGGDGSALNGADGETMPGDAAAGGDGSGLTDAQGLTGGDAAADARLPPTNVDCASNLPPGPTVLFCADFNGSFPFGFTNVNNSDSLTTVTASLNGGTSTVVDLTDATDGGSTAATTWAYDLGTPTGPVTLDFDVAVLSNGYSSASLGLLRMGMWELGVGVDLGGLRAAGLTASQEVAGSGFHHVAIAIDFSGAGPYPVEVVIDSTVIASGTTATPKATLSVIIGTFEIGGTTGGTSHIQFDNVVVREK